MTRQSTLQTLDPLGVLAGRPLTILGALTATVIAVVGTWLQADEVGNLGLGLAAIGLVCLASAFLIHYCAPDNAPFGRQAAVLVVATAVLGHVLAAASEWGLNQFARDDWPPLAVAILVLALSPYRPPGEVVALGVSSAVLVGCVTFAQSAYFVAQIHPAIYVIIAMTPVLACSLAGAAFASHAIARLRTWRARAGRASEAHAQTLHDAIVRSVQQGRVSILNRDVVPLFTRMLDSGRVEAGDVERSAAVSTAIRALMVEETERSWLDDMLQPVRARSVVLPSHVDDPERLAETMSFEQRAAVRAFLVALIGKAVVDPRDVRVVLHRDSAECQFELRVRVGIDTGALHSTMAPYVAVLRAVFDKLTLDLDHSDLTVRFCYGPE